MLAIGHDAVDEAHVVGPLGAAELSVRITRPQFESIARTFSWARAIYNREHHTIAGLMTGLTLLAAKLCFK